MLESCKKVGCKIFVKRLIIGKTSFLHFIFVLCHFVGGSPLCHFVYYCLERAVDA